MTETSLSVLSERFSKHIIALTDGFEIKTLLGAILTYFVENADIISQTFKTDTQLIFSLVVLITLDFITGVYASIKAKRKITSMGFRATFAKVLEYTFLLGSITVVSNMDETLAWIQTWAFIFVCLTEVKSIGENIPATKWFMDKFLQAIKEKNNIAIGDDKAE
jgi:phage-related holin